MAGRLAHWSLLLRLRSLAQQAVDLSRDNRVGKSIVIPIDGLARQLHHPVVHQRRDCHDGATVLAGLPHLDCRSHRRLRHVGNDEIKDPAHFHVPHKHIPRLPPIVADGSGVVGKWVVDFGLGPMVLDEVAKRVSIRLIVHQCRNV